MRVSSLLRSFWLALSVLFLIVPLSAAETHSSHSLFPSDQRARSFTQTTRMQPAVQIPVLLAPADAADDATKSEVATDPKSLPPEQKKKVKSAVLMLSILSGILLSGLLLIIVAIAVRGLQRKLAGPTRLDREPEDVLPATMAQPHGDMAPAGPSGEGNEASEETRFT
jgi:hypothetical protein